jgi:hypothetical protein
MYDWTSGVEDYLEATKPAPAAKFWPVRLDKFLILTVLTVGFYALVWFWRNWRAVESEHPRSVSPFWRTWFSGIFYFSLVERVGVPGGVLLALGYVILGLMTRLPGDLWFIGLTAYLMLVPTVVQINRLNRSAVHPPSSGWRKRDAIVPVVAGPIALLVFGSFFLPDYVVLRGSEVEAQDVVAMRVAGILMPDEDILYIYADDPADVIVSGVIVSDIGFTSYWQDSVTEEPIVAFMPYDRIATVDVNYSDAWWEDTRVRVTDIEGVWVEFGLPNEAQGDKKFVGEMRRRVTEMPAALAAGDA